MNIILIKMGGSQSTKTYQQNTSNVVNDIISKCNISDSEIIQNVDANLNNVFIGGDFDLTNQIILQKGNGKCYLKSTEKSLSDSNFDTSIDQDTLKGVFNALGWNTENINENQSNTINFMNEMQNVCNVDDDTEINNVTLNATNSWIMGNLEVANRTEPGGCVIDATARATSVSKGQATTDQITDSSLFGGLFGNFGNLIVIGIIAVIGVIIIVVVIKLLHSGEDEKGEKSQPIVEEPSRAMPMQFSPQAMGLPPQIQELAEEGAMIPV